MSWTHASIRFLLPVALTLSAALSFSSVVADEANGTRRAIRAYVQAGEFGPAINVARKLSPADRDAALAEIALAQAASRARAGSSTTLASITDEAIRGQAIDDMRRQPLRPVAYGGGVIADFDTLIELITTTVSPDSWVENGGKGAVNEFPTGVIVDGSGILTRTKATEGSSLRDLRTTSLLHSPGTDVRCSAKLRKVSLTRLETAVQLRYARGLAPDASMQALAGLQRIQYVFLYPESGEIVIAGPAGDWRRNAEGRDVSVVGGQAVLQLDDFVTLLRNAQGEGKFGCAITPTRENLEAAQTYLNEAAKRPLKPGASSREKWVSGLREALGYQEITIHGVDPGSRAARTIVEADYHMKLVGMGLEKGVLGVTSYLDDLNVRPGESLPPMNVLRWWFTLGDGYLRTTPTHDAFEFRGSSVKVLSENERLTERGERIHTGASSEGNARFAHSFSKHFEELAAKYPVYAELRNLCDLATVVAIVEQEHAAQRCSWQALHFRDPQKYVVPIHDAPKKVMSVANYRVVNEKTLVAGVSGGVEYQARKRLSEEQLRTDDYGDLQAGKVQSKRPAIPETAWWWD